MTALSCGRNCEERQDEVHPHPATQSQQARRWPLPETLGALGITVAAATGSQAAPGAKAPKPTLAFRPDGKFKIVQFNDTQDDEQTDRRTIELMDRTLDAEKPDFVVINGDVINGGCDSELEVKQALNHVVQPMESRQIPWAVTFGNHDEDSVQRTGMTEAKMLRFLQSYQYNMNADSIAGPDRHVQLATAGAVLPDQGPGLRPVAHRHRPLRPGQPSTARTSRATRTGTGSAWTR